LQPAIHNPALKNDKTAKACKVTAFFTFPPYTASNGSIYFATPFFSNFPSLSMCLQVTTLTGDGPRLWTQEVRRPNSGFYALLRALFFFAINAPAAKPEQLCPVSTPAAWLFPQEEVTFKDVSQGTMTLVSL
jgi:hypothetical protein